MRLRCTFVIVLTVLSAASAAVAQPDAVFVSGLAHVALGDAHLGPVDGRRLPVHNLGSSGEDGVEITLNSAFGGGAELDLQPLMSTPGASFRTKHKGWDGLIYGSHRLLSNSDGTGTLTCDYSAVGATGVEIVQHDASGAVIFSGSFPGPIVDLPLDHQIFYCPPGTTPIAGVWYGQLCNICPWITVYVFYCDGVMYTEFVVTPTLPVGTPDSPGLESMSITGSGIPELVASSASIRSYGVQCWGLDPAQLSEQCDDPNGCTPEQRKLHADNLGSSGLDGVAIALPPNNGGVSVAMRPRGCCRGHVIIMKAFDDAGQELRVSRTQTLDPNGIEVLDADFSALGATGFRLTLLDDTGVVVGPPVGTDFINGGPRPWFTNRCPPGSTEWWINTGTPGNPVWTFQGCIGMYDFVLPGSGEVVPNVSSFRVEPLGATSSFGSRTRCELTSDDDEGLVIESITVLPPPTYVSGLLHRPIGDAQFGSLIDSRRLPVHNLGSSGEDGVEVLLNSAFGGGAEIDLQPLMSTPGASLRHKHKGWDGLIYGNHRLLSNGDGTGILTIDYSGAGAIGIEIARLDVNGSLISTETYPGPVVDYPLNSEIFYCPPGTQPVAAIWRGRLCNTCPWEERIVFFCDGVMYTEQLVITPTFPVGTPDSPGLEALSITGSGIPELVVSNAHLRTFGVQCWGLDPAQLSEQCDDPNGCTPEQRKLHVDNLGSSGNDGVAIDIAPNSSGLSVGLKRRVPPGHVTLMKRYDDAARELHVSRTLIDPLAGIEELDADFAALGASGYRLTLLDDTGVVVGPPEGTAIYNGGPRPYFTNRCPPGQTEWWISVGPPSNPTWVFQGCLGMYDFVLPGYGEVPNVSSFRIAALDATSSFGPLTKCAVTSDDPDGFVIDGVIVTPFATGDLNCDGAVDFDDINPFVLALANPASYQATYPHCGVLNADCNGDGVVDFGDINGFVALLSGGG